MVAIVPEDGEPHDRARRRPPGATASRLVLDEADSRARACAPTSSGPSGPGDPGWAAFYVPVRLGTSGSARWPRCADRGEPSRQKERRSFVRWRTWPRSRRATERYQHQRARAGAVHERQRIADDLHDDVAQILFAAQLVLDAILQRRTALGEDVVAAITRARGLLIRGDTTIRTSSTGCRSAATADIGTRLSSAVAGVEDEFSLPCACSSTSERCWPGEAALGGGVRRAGQGRARVARQRAKHAGPCRVVCRCAWTGRKRLTLTVRRRRARAGRGRGGEPATATTAAPRWRAIRRLGGTLARGEARAVARRSRRRCRSTSAAARPADTGGSDRRRARPRGRTAWR